MNRQATAVVVFGVDPLRIGSAEAFARELALQITSRGWKCVLCYLKQPAEPVRSFLQLPNVSLEVIEDSDRLAWKPTQALARILRIYRPRVLSLNYTGMLSLYPWTAKMLGVESIFFTDHGSRPAGYVPRRASAWKRTVSRMVNQPLTGYVGVSEFGRKYITDLDIIDRQRIEMIYNAVDVERAVNGLHAGAEFRGRYLIPQDSVLVTQVSWMIPEKGIPELLEAAGKVIQAEPKVHFLIAGDGAHRTAYENKARALGLGDRVTFTGNITDPLACGLFAAADIVCQMSQWEEVFGYVIAEAMACGKPMVATRVGGIPELVEHGVSGFLVDRRDVSAMALRILELVRDPELRKRMGAAGLDAVRKKFELKTNVAQFVKLFGIDQSAIAANQRAERSSDPLASQLEREGSWQR
jgi:glycosyltransferase involved in cell wall biosynthesis